MRRSLALFLVAAAACGGSKKSTTTPPPLPEAKAEPAPEAKPAEPAPKKPEPPPAPTGPVEITVPAPKVTVKLVTPGKGKRAPLKLGAKQGTKASVELAMDFSGKTTAPPELGGPKDEVAPTVVLTGDLEAQEADKDGTKFQLTVSGVDARDVPGTKMPAAEFKADLQSLSGMTIAGSVGANGATGDLKMRVEKPDAKSEGAMGLIKLSLMPIWPVLPAEPVGVGAKWQVTMSQKIADRLEVTQTTDYEVVSHKGTAWTIKSTSKITGTDQEIEGAKFGAIGGSGTSEATINDGALVAANKQKLATDFTATASPPDQKPVQLQFHLEQGNQVTSK